MEECGDWKHGSQRRLILRKVPLSSLSGSHFGKGCADVSGRR